MLSPPSDARRNRGNRRGLVACTFSAARFHHREHLLATAYLMRCAPGTDVWADLPDIIRRYNVAMGRANSDEAGYHHTIPLFYVDVLERFFADRLDRTLVEACAELLASALADKDFVLRFYTRERLFSLEARRGWVAPDRGSSDLAIA